MTEKNKRVLVGMSGGVDSSACAALLKEQGYEVIGLTISSIKLKDNCKPSKDNKSCCTYQSSVDAADVCEILGIEHYMMDLTEAFRKNVIDNFVSEYLAGRTPNPCVECNPAIKWSYMLSKADALGAYFVATGHYAQVEHLADHSRLLKGKDRNKDQSYFLWKVSQEQLKRTLFPIGDIVKSETRKIAERFNLPIAHKPDSQEVCFIPDNDYRKFLRDNVSDLESKIGEGQFILNGKIIGKHKGYPFYTIGQRKGLGISHESPLFVKDIIPESNLIVLASEEELYSPSLTAHKLNLISDRFNLSEGGEFSVKIRYRDAGSPAFCKVNPQGELEINFAEPRKSVTPGQSVVLYERDEVIAGGVIKSKQI